MVEDGALYEVDWQLYEPSHIWQAPHAQPVGIATPPPQARLETLVAYARLLATADVAAIVACRRGALTVQVAAPSAPSLRTGSALTLRPSLGLAGHDALGLLLSGQLRWCRCSPLEQYKHAVLVAAPSLAPSRRVLLVARNGRRFTELDLGLTAAYLAQFRLSGTAERRDGTPRTARLSPPAA
jgi:hypothetical protein